MASHGVPVQVPKGQEMTLESGFDARSVHVASLDTSSGTCFCCTSGLATCMWCFTGAVSVVVPVGPPWAPCSHAPRSLAPLHTSSARAAALSVGSVVPWWHLW